VLERDVIATTVPPLQEQPDEELDLFPFWDLPEVIDNQNPPLPESIDACPTITDLDTLIDIEDELLSLRPEVKEIITSTPLYDILNWGGGKALHTINKDIYPISCAKLDLGDRGYTFLVGLLVKNTDDSHGILHTQFGGEIDGEVVSEWIGFQSPENSRFYDRPVRASTEEVFDIMKSMRMRGMALALKVVNSSDFRWTESTLFSEELLNQQSDALLQIISDMRQTSGISFKGIVGFEQSKLVLPLSTIFAVPDVSDSLPEDQDDDKSFREGDRSQNWFLTDYSPKIYINFAGAKFVFNKFFH
jgi:hypothetical protein